MNLAIQFGLDTQHASMLIRFPICIIAAVTVGCMSQEHAAASPGPIAASLVARDSAVGEERTYVWYRVALKTTGRTDTIVGVMTDQEPLVTNDGRVLGLTFDSSGAVAAAYQFDPATRRLDRHSLPKDISPYFSEAAFSPDGARLAYIAQTPESDLSAVVIGWPDGVEIRRVRAGPGFPSDVNFNHLHWLGRDGVEFAIRTGPLDGPWVHIVVGGNGSIQMDTLPTEPTWPQRSP